MILEYLKGALSKNLPTMIVLAVVWYNLHTQINEITTNNAVRSVVVEELNDNIKDINSSMKDHAQRLNQLERKMSSHMGEAYLRDEEEER